MDQAVGGDRAAPGGLGEHIGQRGAADPVDRGGEALGLQRTPGLLGELPTVDHLGRSQIAQVGAMLLPAAGDRKSTRLNSSHVAISYADFCLKKKKMQESRD